MHSPPNKPPDEFEGICRFITKLTYILEGHEDRPAMDQIELRSIDDFNAKSGVEGSR